MEFNEVVMSRRSIRKYKEEGITKEELEQLIKAALMAPSWKNAEATRYHVVYGEEMLKKVKYQGLAEFNAQNTECAPALIVISFVKDRSGFDRDGTPSNELGNGWGCYDAGLATQNLLLKACDMGLSTLVMGIRNEAAIRELLQIPADQTIISVIGVGHGDIDPAAPKRKTIEEVATFY